MRVFVKINDTMEVVEIDNVKNIEPNVLLLSINGKPYCKITTSSSAYAFIEMTNLMTKGYADLTEYESTTDI